MQDSNGYVASVKIRVKFTEVKYAYDSLYTAFQTLNEQRCV